MPRLVMAWLLGIGLCRLQVEARLFARKKRLGFFLLTDFTASRSPIVPGAGRLGNFINHELQVGASTHV
nr:prolipoprotein diacylglyceryl transferase family protein [Halomonas sp. LBP4]